MSDVRAIDYSQLREIATRVVLSDVRLQSVMFTTHVPPSGLPRDCSLSYSMILTDYDWKSVSPDAFETYVSYLLTGVAKTQDGTQDGAPVVLFEISLAWVAAYYLRNGETGSTESMLDFAYANGQLNVFPYHRKQVVDITASSGWPALVLPVFTSPNSRPLKGGSLNSEALSKAGKANREPHVQKGPPKKKSSKKIGPRSTRGK